MEPTKLGGIGGEGLGPFGKLGIFGAGEAGGATALAKVTGTISAVIGFMTVAAAIWFLFNFITGGFPGLLRQETKHSCRKRKAGSTMRLSDWSSSLLAGEFSRSPASSSAMIFW